MKFNCLVINAGSSSLKFRLYKLASSLQPTNKEENQELHEVTSGICELGPNGCFIIANNGNKIKTTMPFSDHKVAVHHLLDELIKYQFISSVHDISVIANRIVHGGEIYKESSILEEKDVQIIQELSKLAPLHNPPAVSAIKSFMKLCSAKHIGVFDTAFHQSIPRINYEYAIPLEWRKKHQIRRYGMHGTSYKYVTREMEIILKKKKVNLIICHLGNGASICAVKNSKSLNTSMGLTPLAGLVMGTRSGDIDPSIFSYIERLEGKTAKEIEDVLNRESGIKAFAGCSDMREARLAAKSNSEAKFAFEIWSKRIAHYIAMYMLDLKGAIDALVFTAGIGENSPYCRSIILDHLSSLGFLYNEQLNRKQHEGTFHFEAKDSKYRIMVVPTNEELMMALDAKALLFDKKL